MVLAVLCGFAWPAAPRISGQQGVPASAAAVARQAQDRDTGRDSRAEMRMRLVDRQGRTRERALTLWSRRATAGTGDRTLLRFSAPNDIRNTGLLVWEHEDADDERFLFLPALGRVRRIAGAETQESFAGSDLSYEDIGGRQLDDYTYTFVDQRGRWTAPGGAVEEAWVVEARARDGNVSYPRSVSTIVKASLVLVHAEQFNRHGERAKVFDVRRLERVDGIWTVLALTVTNEQARTRTDLDTTSIRYNVGLTEADFSRRRLEQVPGVPGWRGCCGAAATCFPR